MKYDVLVENNNAKGNDLPNEYQFDNASLLANALADSVAHKLRQAIKDRGQASIAVSGGRTPVAFFSALSEQALDWPSVWITLTDERWVDITHPDSNEALVRKCLLRQHAAHARFIGLRNNAATPSEGETECEAALSRLPRPFDVVLLGMGNDGHTASLFPNAIQLASALDIKSPRLCSSITPPSAPHLRMTLTLSALLACRHIVLLFHGSDKHNIYREALAPSTSMDDLPISAVLHQHEIPVDVYWCA